MFSEAPVAFFFYVRTLCSLLRNLAVRADTERKPAENKIRTYVRTYVRTLFIRQARVR